MKPTRTAKERRPRDRKTILPRLIRFRDAPAYLGMDRNRFNREVRQMVTEVRIGRQGVAFDRLELDDWADHYVRCNGRPGKERTLWDKEQRPDYTEMPTASGTSTSDSAALAAFKKAVERAGSKKRSIT